MCLTKWLHECGTHKHTPIERWMSCCVQNLPWEYSIHTILLDPFPRLISTSSHVRACRDSYMCASQFLSTCSHILHCSWLQSIFFSSFRFLILPFVHWRLIIIARRMLVRNGHERGTAIEMKETMKWQLIMWSDRHLLSLTCERYV